MNFNSDLESDEVRREEPVALDCASVTVSQTKALHSGKSYSSAVAPKILSLATSASQAETVVPPMDLNPPASPKVLGRESDSAKEASPDNLLINTAGVDLHPWYSGFRANAPPNMNLRLVLDQSPTSSNSSDGSSLFGSPTAMSPGARSTSSGDYGCDSTSSSRDVSPFGSPSSSFPVFRFAIPRDGLAMVSQLPATS